MLKPTHELWLLCPYPVEITVRRLPIDTPLLAQRKIFKTYSHVNNVFICAIQYCIPQNGKRNYGKASLNKKLN